MSDRTLAVVRTWRDLPAAFRAAIDERKTTCESVDVVAGLPAGYTAKLTAPVPTRGLGQVSFDNLLETLGMMLVLVEDPKRSEKVQQRLEAREEYRVKNARKHSAVVHVRISKVKLRKMGRKGGANSRKHMPRWKARRLARKAARARWATPPVDRAQGTLPAISPPSEE